jgi:hypothetical protein
MRHVLCWIVMQLALLSAAEAQVPNDATGVPKAFEFPLPRQTVVLEFNQDECQSSVTEEYVIPDVPGNPGNVALTMLFNAACDLGLSTADTVPMAVMGPSTAGTVTTAHRPQREIIEEFLLSPDSLRTVVKFGK